MVLLTYVVLSLVSHVASHMLRGQWDAKPAKLSQALQRSSFDAIYPLPTSLYQGTRPLGVRKSRILLHHVWKCGGANLCDMAIRNGEAVPNPKLPNPSSRCDVLAPGYRTPSEVTLLEANYTFAAWQAPLAPGAFTGVKREFALVTILRNPLDQALSHFHHAQRDFKLFADFSAFLNFGMCVATHNVSFQSLNGCEQNLVQKSLTPPDIHPFAIFRDNQQLRWLEPTDVGMAVQGRPHLSSEDLKAGKKRLDLFDEVIILEEFHRRERWRFAKYGWQDLNDERGANLHWEVALHGRSNATAQLSPEILSRLREIQTWDQELYRHGQDVARRQADLSHDMIQHAQQVSH